MPWALWLGMRLVCERGNHLLVLVGGLMWPVIGGHIVENAGVGKAETVLYGALFVLLGGLLSLVEMPRIRDLDT
ncbi:hypothetical protein [Streptomyces sp. NPDC006610]|uniref:hypothetical protein n=1 Tax=Streptomyces sp. NPDC006610 TaxID=3154584 RepID=UPI0033AED9E6